MTANIAMYGPAAEAIRQEYHDDEDEASVRKFVIDTIIEGIKTNNVTTHSVEVGAVMNGEGWNTVPATMALPVAHRPPHPDVVVVGAGPVGLVAACELARRRVSVRVIDKLTQATDESRAIAVHACSLDLGLNR
jgi:FAD binding domain